jgi:mono/diheme cytochrome c family protein
LTEIPEHLLQRSRERRAALGLGGDAPTPASGGEATPAAPAAAAAVPATGGGAQPPATPTPAVPAEPKPEPPKPVPAYVQAAQRRRRIPFWAMPVLAALPLWGYVYVRTLSPPPVENDPYELGGEIYAGNCATCHGGTGGGVPGGAPQLSDGAVQKVWGDYQDHLMWVKLGEKEWPGNVYGDEDTSKDANAGIMPGFGGALTDQEIAQVVLYERRVLSDEEAPDEADDLLLQIANGDATFKDAELGPTSEKDGVTEDELG